MVGKNNLLILKPLFISIIISLILIFLFLAVFNNNRSKIGYSTGLNNTGRNNSNFFTNPINIELFNQSMNPDE
ncbi:MAG: hypothetical protein UV73_C0015G0032 [Candidatus Gottesmanbacteria bacterium GW2011_GWA2_43_14]|uniref:Uncharacterized protein n=1 Tax=Candidatus Gottesmanbacteria bacterium GW2011_GWA2_43_14 TaxID=1618443 RepID=A0A0G1DDI8_9BACT|nr:MAG: hypothetical protein UV73_C0015G0032 [Candidatus Gottesmanbacteria bacterium GW2011_GWA2_43_14]